MTITDNAFDQIECWSQCKSTEDCNWFSFNFESKVCYLYETCFEIDDGKWQFVSGEKECSVEKNAGE